MKKIFILISAVCIAMCIPCFAKAAVIDSGTCGTNVTWTLDDNGTLTISGEGEMSNPGPVISSLDTSWRRNRDSVVKVIIESGVTRIGDGSFYLHENLTSVTIPDSVTEIGGWAFNGCKSLTNIIIPNSVHSIKNDAFTECDSLPKVTIPDTVTEIGDSAFGYCDSLTDIEVGDNNPNYCSVDGVLFSKDKSKLKQYPSGKQEETYTVPDLVTRIGNSAFGGSKLTDIPTMTNVTELGNNAFARCLRLTSITIPSCITSADYCTFFHCDNLTDVILPNSLTSVSNRMFDQCASLKSVLIPNSINRINEEAFRFCENLSDVYYGGSKERWNSFTSRYIWSSMSIETPPTIHYNAIGTTAPIIADNMTAVKESGTVKVSVPFESVEYDSHIITVALKGNNMSGVAFDTVSAGETEKTLIIDTDDADSVKTFAWDSLNGMRPLCEAKTVTIE